MERGLERPSWQEAILALAIACGAWTAVTSEVLSSFRALERGWIAALWLPPAAALAFFLARQARAVRCSPRRTPRIDTLALLCLSFVAVDVVILLVIALVAPPNTNDALQYHLSRVAHWAQQRSLSFYPTPIERQLWMPPFAEVAILHLYLLAGGDRLANLVQWSSMVLGLVTISGIAWRLGANAAGQAFAILFAATLPMGILQATSAQNDYVTGFWALCLASLAVKSHQVGLKTHEWALVGLATGLGMLTKATFYALAFPFLLWLGISCVRRTGWMGATRVALAVTALAVLLNVGHWSRNLRAYGLPLGPPQAVAAHGNQMWSWKVIASNALRSLTLHIATPYGDANGLIRNAVVALHEWIGIDVDDPRTTMDPYRVKRSFHEDYAGNPFHALFVPLSLALLMWPARPTTDDAPSPRRSMCAPLTFAGTVVASALLFFLLYKWQATGSRLQLGLFLLWAPITGVAWQRVRSLVVRRLLGVGFQAFAIALLTAASLRTLLINPSRPMLPRPSDGTSLWNTSRAELLLINAPEFLPSYLPLIEAAPRSNCKAMGLMIDSSHPEYPFWAFLATPDSGIHLEHVGVPTPSGGIPPSGGLCAILCTQCSDRQLDGMELRFNIAGHYSLYLPAP